MTHLRIGPRLMLGFGILLLLLATVAGIGAYQTTRINDRVLDLSQNWMPSIKALANLRFHADALRRAELGHVLESDPQEKAKQAAIGADIRDKKWPDALAQYQKLANSPKEAELLAEINTQWANYLEQNKTLLSLSDAGDTGFGIARALSAGDSAVAFASLMKPLEEAIEFNEAGGVSSAQDAEAVYRSVLQFTAVLVVLALVVGAALGVVITRSITRPLARAAQIANAVAGGDLGARIEVQGRDETALLLRALQDMSDSLASIVGRVRSSSDSIATGSAQIATGNLDLSERTEKQASSLEQTAAAMEQMSGAVKNNAETARQANTMAGQASAAAQVGGEKVAAVVTTMQDITASSRKIADIIGVIDGIAFQTNILALNAAVEAARAGEQGRGFAVVATEVRSLAGRSANAAKEIKSLIHANMEKAETGANQVNEAGASMDAIVAQVQRVSQLIADISSATAEQSTGIGQVSQAVAQLDQVTQQNAALVEESAAAAASLKHQAGLLAEAVGVFKLRH